MVSYGKTVPAAIDQSMKDAVHGVLFHGFTGKLGECTSQKPIISSESVANNHEKYFQQFFDKEGGWRNFATIPHASTARPTKVGKSYKVEVVVSVAKERLRKELENAGIIKSLSFGF